MAVFLFNRHDIPIVAHSYQHVLEVFLIFFILQHTVNISLGLAFQFNNTAAQPHQFRRRSIPNLMVVVKHRGHFMGQLGKITNGLRFFFQLGIQVFFIGKIRADVAIPLYVVPNINAFLAVQHHFPAGFFQGRPDINNAAKRRRRFALQTMHGFFRIIEPRSNDCTVTAGPEPSGDFFGKAGRCQPYQHLLYLIKS